jgi:hypothetical protein
MSLPFYNELNLIKSPNTTDANAITLILKVVNGYVPTGHPITESLMYLACQEYQVLQSKFTTAQRTVVLAWIRRLGYAQMNFINTNSSKNNNWLAKQIQTVAICGDVLRDTTLLNWANNKIMFYITTNFYTNHTCIDFKERDSVTYVTYSLNALVLAIIVLRKHFKIDYYNYKSLQNSTLKSCINWLKPYIEGKKTNLMFLKSIYASDKRIHADQFGKPWQKQDARQLFINARPLDSTLLTYFNTFLA